MKSIRMFAAAVCLGSLASSAFAADGMAAPYVWPTPTAAELRLVRGALDLHVHLDPDSLGPHSQQLQRRLDVLDMAKRARELGMRGFVIKQHYDQTAQLAFVTRKLVPGVEVFGRVGQNFAVGGVNAEAVWHMAEVSGGWGRIVWLPTWDAENNIRHRAAQAGKQPDRPFVPVTDSAGGELTAAVMQVIAAVRDAHTRDSNGPLVLATGHLAPAEVLQVVRAARRAGVQRVLVTHAFGDPVFMSIAQMREAVAAGAMIEFVASYAMGPNPLFQPAVYADAIRQVGVENVIVSSDLGQMGRILPPDGLAVFAGLLLKHGFTAAEVHAMLADNPARLLGLPVLPPLKPRA
jgi:hypothetical protein